MNLKNDTGHIDEMVTDYVLDLLPIEDRLAIHSHVSGCPRCEHLLESHRQIGVAVKQTITRSTLNEPKECKTPTSMDSMPWLHAATIMQIHKQIAIAGMALMLLVASIGFQMNIHLNNGFATVPVAESAEGVFQPAKSTPATTLESDMIPGQAIPTPAPAISEPWPRVVLIPEASSPILLTVTP